MKISKPKSIGALYVGLGVGVFIVIELLALSLLHRDMSVGASAAIMAVMVMGTARTAYNAGMKDRGEPATSETKH